MNALFGSEVAAFDLGARTVGLTLPAGHRGQCGSLKDMACVLGRIYDAVE
ncbi:hypothetical protein FB004_10395 [Sinorhizobium medicae]|nr:hypothetical protein FB004_10395 [Sinorhizobium medicae]